MANNLGSLLVSLGLDSAEFTAGLTKSQYQAQQFAQQMDRVLAGAIIKAELALRAAGAAAEFAVGAFKTLTSKAGEFQDLADATGATGEGIASLAVAASTAGIQIADVAGALNKLTKNLTGVDDESAAAGAALKALNLPIAEFRKLDPVAQYEAISKALANFADGTEKVAVAQALFGKSGGDQLRVLKELADEGGRTNILTQRQIDLADAYGDAQAKSRAKLQQYAQAAATEAIPALTALTNAGGEFVKSFLAVDEAGRQLNTQNSIAEFAETGARALAVLIDAGPAVVRLFQATGREIGLEIVTVREVLRGNIAVAQQLAKEGRAEIEAILFAGTFSEKLDKAFADMRARAAAQQPFSDARFESERKPRLPFDGVKDNSALQSKLLDGQLKAIRGFAEQQRDALDFANKYAQGTYDTGVESLREFFEVQKSLRAAGLQVTVDALNKEIEAQRIYRDQALKPEVRVAAETAIAEAVRKRGEAIDKAAQEEALAAQTNAAATLQLQQRYNDLQATIKQLSGDTAGASAIRIAQQVEDARKLIKAASGDAGQADAFGALLTQTDALARAQTDYNRLLEQARNAEEAIALAAEAGGKSELQTLIDLGAARKQSLGDLNAMVEKATELARVLGTPEAVAFAEKLSLAFQRATLEVDPLLSKIRDVAKDAGSAIASGFEDAIVKGGSLRNVLKGIEQDLLRIVTRNLVTQPLGNAISNAIAPAGGGGFGGLVSNLFGSFIPGLFGGFNAFDPKGIGITSGGNSLVGYGLGGGRANGGPTMPHTLYEVAEMRPEVWTDGSRQYLLTGNRRGSIDPSPSFGGGRGGMVVHNHFHVEGQVDKRSQQQMAAAAARSISLANARNN